MREKVRGRRCGVGGGCSCTYRHHHSSGTVVHRGVHLCSHTVDDATRAQASVSSTVAVAESSQTMHIDAVCSTLGVVESSRCDGHQHRRDS